MAYKYVKNTISNSHILKKSNVEEYSSFFRLCEQITQFNN